MPKAREGNFKLQEEKELKFKMLAVFAALLIGFCVTSASASILPCALAGYNQYTVSGFSCTENNLLVDNFTFSASASPTGLVTPASGVTTTPITTIGNEGFQFNPGLGVMSVGGLNSFQDIVIGFQVHTIDRSATITDIHAFFNGSFTGTGQTDLTETACKGGGPIQNCVAANLLQIHDTNPPFSLNSFGAFTGVADITILKDILSRSGEAGSANISVVIDTVSQSPEPATLSLIGGSLIGLALRRKKRRI